MTALNGLRVVEAATLFAGPLASMHLGDFGAEVIKVEHPQKPDPSRGHGPAEQGVNLWWKTLSRNKRNISLDLSTEKGSELLLKLLQDADVFIENFRPGVLAKWGITPERLRENNPKLVIIRITAFGQTGPYSKRPGFGTLAEAMSGFAATTGFADGPPMLPPLGLADGITGIAAAYAAMVGIFRREHTGLGGEVDMSILEPMMMMMGPQITAFGVNQQIQPRTGNRSANNSPRNIYLTEDNRWVAISTSSQSIAERVMRLVGREDFIEKPWFSSGKTRAEHADELDEVVAEWISKRPAEEVIQAFEQAQAAAALIFDVSDIFKDPQVIDRGIIAEVQDDELGELKMQSPLFKLDGEYPLISSTGANHSQHTNEILAGLGLSLEQIESLRESGVIK